MKKEIILIEHNVAQMEHKEKLAVGVLLHILPLLGAIEAYQYYGGNAYYWLACCFVICFIVLGMKSWNSFSLRLCIFSQFMIASSLIAFHTLISMMRGLSIIIEPSPFQYGLVNFADLAISCIILCYVTFVTSYVMLRRREFKQQEQAYNDIKI
jgi:hypothetical protein